MLNVHIEWFGFEYFLTAWRFRTTTKTLSTATVGYPDVPYSYVSVYVDLLKVGPGHRLT